MEEFQYEVPSITPTASMVAIPKPSLMETMTARIGKRKLSMLESDQGVEQEKFAGGLESLSIIQNTITPQVF